MTRSHRLFSLFALALGLAALGCGGTPTTSGDSSAPTEAAPPKVEVRGETAVNAGEVDFARPRDFAFSVVNIGGSPLKLTLAKKSCSCADVTVPADPIEPGQAGRVAIHWLPIAGSVGAYNLTVDVKTNDPGKKMLHFVVIAHVRPVVHVFIDGKETDPYSEFALDFGDNPISPGEPRTRDVKVFSTRLAKFDLKPSCTVPGFDIQKEPLPPNVPVGDYNDVLSGYKLEIKATKDLPFGYIRAQLNLALSNMGEGEPDRTIELPLLAVGGQGLVTVSPPGILKFSRPTITDADTAKVFVTYVKRPPKEEVTVESVKPSFVTVDKPEKGLDGKWRIVAHLPKDNAEAAKWEADPPMIGEVVLKVAGLDRLLTIEVKWQPEAPAK